MVVLHSPWVFEIRTRLVFTKPALPLPYRRAGPYTAAKAEVIMLTRQVANEVGKGYRSGAEVNRTPDLRRAKAAPYFSGPFWCLQYRCKSAYF
jgi:hypothetical protein